MANFWIARKEADIADIGLVNDGRFIHISDRVVSPDGEMVDALDLKSNFRKEVRVRAPLRALYDQSEFN